METQSETKTTDDQIASDEAEVKAEQTPAPEDPPAAAPEQSEAAAPEQSEAAAPEQSDATAPEQSEAAATEQSEAAAPEQSDAAAPDKSDDDLDFAAMVEQSMSQIQEGEVAQGRIVEKTKEYVTVDVGYKSEGEIALEEFRDPNTGEITAEVGDEVEVLIERLDDDDGLILSKEKAAKIKVWDEISRVYQDDGHISGTIVSRVKGGMSVDIGVPAFLPGSQVDLRPVRNLDSLIGQTFDFKILKFNKKRANIVLSRRALLETEREIMKAKTMAILEEGRVMDGVVKNITDYGVFVDLGGIDGLLHITDMSWGRVGHPSEMFSIGDNIRVRVLHFDRERERVSLGLKQLKEDPWTSAGDRYPPQTRVTGKVVSLADYGAFIEVEEGVEGLIHVSEMSWTRKIRHPSKILNVGDMVDAVVLSINTDQKRISLGMKQVEPNPWDVVAEKYPVGTVIEGRIKNITDFGIFIGIDEGIDGLVHISDISWTKRIKHPSELYNKGDEVRAVVLSIDKENERFSVGIKQLETDPWEEIPTKYQVGTRVSGTVTNVTDFGIFVEIEEGIEGLIHVSEISREKIKTPIGQFAVGDVLTAEVVSVSRRERKIGLSIKRLEESASKGEYRAYMRSQQSATTRLGDLINDLDLQSAVAEPGADEPEAAQAEPEAEAPEKTEAAAEEAPPEETPAEETDKAEAEKAEA